MFRSLFVWVFHFYHHFGLRCFGLCAHHFDLRRSASGQQQPNVHVQSFSSIFLNLVTSFIISKAVLLIVCLLVVRSNYLRDSAGSTLIRDQLRNITITVRNNLSYGLTFLYLSLTSVSILVDNFLHIWVATGLALLLVQSKYLQN